MSTVAALTTGAGDEADVSRPPPIRCATLRVLPSGDGPKQERVKSLNPIKITRRERDSWEVLPPGWDADRPRTRGDCVDGPRPCPWVSCRYHLYLYINPKYDSIHFGFPEIPPDEMERMPATCVLDVADKQRDAEKPLPLEQIGAHLGQTLERARQLMKSAVEKLHAALPGALGVSADELGTPEAPEDDEQEDTTMSTPPTTETAAPSKADTTPETPAAPRPKRRPGGRRACKPGCTCGRHGRAKPERVAVRPMPVPSQDAAMIAHRVRRVITLLETDPADRASDTLDVLRWCTGGADGSAIVRLLEAA